MADIDLSRSHALGLDGAREAVEHVAEDLEDDLDLTHRWEGDTLHFKGSGADGRIHVTSDRVTVAIDLNFFLRTLRSRIRSAAERYLDQHLNPA